MTEWFHHLPKASVVPDFEKAGYQGHWLPGRRISGDHGLVIVVKRRFDVDTASARCAPADITEPVVLCTEFADPENAAEVIRHLAEFHRSGGTVVLVTHGEAVNAHADRTLSLEQGRLVAN